MKILFVKILFGVLFLPLCIFPSCVSSEAFLLLSLSLLKDHSPDLSGCRTDSASSSKRVRSVQQPGVREERKENLPKYLAFIESSKTILSGIISIVCYRKLHLHLQYVYQNKDKCNEDLQNRKK